MTFRSLLHAFLHQVESRPSETALLVETDRAMVEVSWKRLHDWVSIFAEELSSRFDHSPDLPRRIGYLSENTESDIVISLACMAVGALEVPIDHRLPQGEVARRWGRVGGQWLEPEYCRTLPPLSQAPNSGLLQADSYSCDDASLMLWSSGTTRQPQGVVLSHRSLVGNAAAKLAAVPQSVDDVRLTVLPLSHAYARTCDFGTWLLSGCRLSVGLGWSTLQTRSKAVRPTLMNVVPSLANRMLEGKVDGLDRLQLLGCGGAALSTTAFEAWRRKGVTVIQGYGLTETGPVICSATPANATAGLVGAFVDGWEHVIRDGQLYVRGPDLMQGYWGDELATQAKIDSLGWFATGDLVESDPETGQLRILGRLDDLLILPNGCKVYPQSIEREVERIEGVDHAMLILGESLQLWIDSANRGVEGAIKEIVSDSRQLGSCTIHHFEQPLSQQAGELTSKGTIRRQAILENRF
ncbi:MAG: AMP-binding protein [Rubripirellula sp.]